MRIPIGILALLLCTFRVSARQIQLRDHNFMIEIPADWGDMSPHPPETLVAVQSADATRKILVFGAKLPANLRPTGATDVRTGAKKSMGDNGWQIGPEKELAIGSLPFVSFTARNPQNDTITAYTTGAGEEIYMVQAFLHGALADDDQELRSIVQSFHLLTPADPLPVTSPPGGLASRAGYIFGRLLFFATFPAIVLVIWLIVRAQTRRRDD